MSSHQIVQDSYDPRLKKANLRKPLPEAPFFRTRKGIWVILFAVVVVIGFVVFGVWFGKLRKQNSTGKQGSSSVQSSTPPIPQGTQSAPSQGSPSATSSFSPSISSIQSFATDLSAAQSTPAPSASETSGSSAGAISTCLFSCLRTAAEEVGCRLT